jgi:tetratricopeptide (TPR) repeat protein
MPLATPTEAALAHCPHCGAEVPADADHCLACGRILHERSTKITLSVTLFLIVAGIALTQYVVNLHRTTEQELAQRWFTRGNEAMQANAPKFAADAYRTALNYDRENQDYRLRLAQALVADSRLAEAHAHLLSLWEEEPANGDVNLTLARLEARRGNDSFAVRYYNNAINGVWQATPRKHRTEARFELAQYLLDHKKLGQTQADLLAILADAPSDPADQLQLGNMLLAVNDPAHALQAYSAVTAKDDNNAQAWLGAAKANLALGNYAEAEHAAAKAAETGATLPDVREQLALTREVLQINPGLRGLPLAERARRVTWAFEASMKRLSSCAIQKNIDLGAAAGSNSSGYENGSSGIAATAAPNTLQLLYASGQQKQPNVTEKALRQDPDALEPAMQYVFSVERATASLCPDMDITDHALLILAQHESETVK